MSRMNNYGNKPAVFVSSTCYDLKQIRADMKEFIENNYGFDAMLSEFDSFPIDPCKGTFENCLDNVDKKADIFILIIGTRYGYVTDKGKSITNLEYLHAKAKSIPIFVFVSNQIINTLPLWRTNKGADFSAIVDNPKIFEFVAEIFDESQQWIYTYESVNDIRITLKNQFALLFSDGLQLYRIKANSKESVINNNLPPEAIRMIIEKPYYWEYKFFAYVVKYEMDNLKKHKWDYKYEMINNTVVSYAPQEFIEIIQDKLDEISKTVDNLGVIINIVIQDAIAEPGEPSDLELMIYTAKWLAEIYQRLIGWSLYFKTICVDSVFDHLIELLYSFPQSVLKSIDDFVKKFYTEITSIPNVADGKEKRINLKITLDGSNTNEISKEIERLIPLLT